MMQCGQNNTELLICLAGWIPYTHRGSTFLSHPGSQMTREMI